MARARYLSSLSTSVSGIEPASTLLAAGGNSGIGKETATAQISYGKQMQKLLWSKTVELLGLATI